MGRRLSNIYKPFDVQPITSTPPTPARTSIASSQCPSCGSENNSQKDNPGTVAAEVVSSPGQSSMSSIETAETRTDEELRSRVARHRQQALSALNGDINTNEAEAPSRNTPFRPDHVLNMWLNGLNMNAEVRHP